jgi:hypothetical protein
MLHPGFYEVARWRRASNTQMSATLWKPSLNEAAGTVEQRGDFQHGRSSTRDDGAREYNLSVTARMLLIGESRVGVSCHFKVLAVAEMSHLTTSA